MAEQVAVDYRCTACDVEGFGCSCWLCGRASTIRPTFVRAPF